MKKLVWDTSALLNLKEVDGRGYSPAGSLYKDLNDGWIKDSYLNIFPAISFFEVMSGISRQHREGRKTLRDFYILSDTSMIYGIDEDLMRKSRDIVVMPGFDMLRGADLVFACIAYLESAYLVTLDNHFQNVSDHIQIIDLNESRASAEYSKFFEYHELKG